MNLKIAKGRNKNNIVNPTTTLTHESTLTSAIRECNQTQKGNQYQPPGFPHILCNWNTEK